jgi:hypothetical protein
LIIWPAVSFARAPQVTQASAAAAQANAQAATAQASALQAASQQVTAQMTTAQSAFRQAMQNYAKAPAGAAKTAAQAAVQQAQKQLVAAQTAARAAAVQAMTARSAAAQAAAQAAGAQAALARQAAVTPAVQPAVATTPTAASVSHVSPGAGSATGASGTSSGKGAGGNSTLSTVLGSVFGNGNSAAGATGANGSKTAKNGTANAANNDAGNNGQTAAPQGNAFAGSNNGGGRGGTQPGATAEQQNAPAGPTRKVGAAFANGALGVGQSTDTLLTVYGCTRMGTQLMCDTDLSNQNNSLTQVNSADQWKDVYLQDDAGDNHMRSMGVFENQNGDQRTSITLPYGEKSRYILVFNGVPANVKSVTLKSAKDTLDVEGIPVASPDGAPAQGSAPSQAAPAGMQPASAPAGRTASRPPHS